MLFSSRGMDPILDLMETFDFELMNPHLDMVELATQVSAGGLFVPCDVVPRVFSKVKLNVTIEEGLTIGFLGQVVNPSAGGFFMVFEKECKISVSCFLFLFEFLFFSFFYTSIFKTKTNKFCRLALIFCANF